MHQLTSLEREQEEPVMPEKLISGDNHIDLTYLPPDLWSSEAPSKWKQLAPRVPPYKKGMFGNIDEMKDLVFEWNPRPGPKPRPTTPELRLADLDRDGLSAGIGYGCLMINNLLPAR